MTKVFEYTQGDCHPPYTVIEMLNDMGATGWQLVHIDGMVYDNKWFQRLYFMRERAPPVLVPG